jgi:hypothetical protein
MVVSGPFGIKIFPPNERWFFARGPAAVSADCRRQNVSNS